PDTPSENAWPILALTSKRVSWAETRTLPRTAAAITSDAICFCTMFPLLVALTAGGRPSTVSRRLRPEQWPIHRGPRTAARPIAIWARDLRGTRCEKEWNAADEPCAVCARLFKVYEPGVQRRASALVAARAGAADLAARRLRHAGP